MKFALSAVAEEGQLSGIARFVRWSILEAMKC
jgi:hypothetical protein